MKENIEFITENKIICCQNREPDNVVDTSLLEKTIQELAEESNMKEKYIEKLKKVKEDLIDEATRNESEMLVRIEEQQKLIHELKVQLLQLKREMDEMVRDIRTVSTQTPHKITEQKQTMTEPIHLHQKIKCRTQTISTTTQTASTANLQTNVINKTNLRSTENEFVTDNQPHRNRILFVAGNHGKRMVKLLISEANDNYIVQSIVKPNANNDELLRTAVSNSLQFTPRDIVILWCDNVNNHLHNHILEHFENTRLLILTEPYRYDLRGINDIIYQNNLKLFGAFAKLKLSNKIVLDCNNSLRKSNYQRDRFTLTIIGKRFLCKKIFQLINTSENEISQLSVKLRQAQRTLSHNIDKQDEHFLYPCLSHVETYLQ